MGPWNHQEFATLVGQYLQGTQPVRVGPRARDIFMSNNLIRVPASAFINVPATPVGGIW
jgi:hypothetical protein